MVQDQLTNYSTTFCPIISLRAAEAEQELAAGISDAKAVLQEELGKDCPQSIPGNVFV